MINLPSGVPFEVIENILDFLDVSNFCKMREVCSEWRDLIDGSTRMWRSACCKYCVAEDIERDRKRGYSWKVNFKPLHLGATRQRG